MTDTRAANRSDLTVPRVVALPSDTGACGFYRLLQPLRLLEAQHKIKLSIEQGPDGRYYLDPKNKFDVLILQKPGRSSRPDDPVFTQFFEEIAREGRRVVYEIDDDVFNVPKENPAHVANQPPGSIERTRQLMRVCRLVTTTTPFFAEKLRHFHSEVRVVPNGIDLAAWRPPGWTRPDNGLETRVVWAASPNHVEDARLLIGPFKILLKTFPQIKLVLAGGRFPTLEAALPPGRFEHAGSVSDMAAWPEFARSLRADIWLAPLVDSKFARCKSNLKALEGWAVGAAVVASDAGPYRLSPDGSPWLVAPLALVRSTDEWCHAIKFLIDVPRHRADLAQRGFEALARSYTAQHSADAWMKVIEEVASR